MVCANFKRCKDTAHQNYSIYIHQSMGANCIQLSFSNAIPLIGKLFNKIIFVSLKKQKPLDDKI